MTPSIFVEAARPGVNGNHSRWRSAGPCDLVNEGEDLTVLRFRELCSVRISYNGGVLRFSFSPEGDFSGRLRLRLGAVRGEKILGAGPRATYDLKGTKLCLPSTGEANGGFLARVPIFFSTKGPWLWLRGGGATAWHFRQKTTEVMCESLPESLSMGFGKEAAFRMALLTDCRAKTAGQGKGRARLPPELQIEPVVGPGSEGEGLADAAFSRAVDGQAPRAIPDPLAWERILSETAAREVSLDYAAQGGALGIVTTLLSLSLAGEGNVFVPAVATGQGGAASPEEAYAALDMATFGPIFLVGGIPPGLGESFLRALVIASRLFGLLRPYRERCSTLWAERGIPVLSHPALAYPDEDALWERSDQYLFGPDMLVAPGATDKDGTRRLELPNDMWVHLWTSRHYPAGTTIVHAPVGRPAVFYRARSEFAPLFDALRQKTARLL